MNYESWHSRHNSVQLFISHLTTWLRTRRFSEPAFRPSGATNHWKNMEKHNVSRLSYLFAHLHLLSSDSSDSFSFAGSSHLCFSICPYCRKFGFETSFDDKYGLRCLHIWTESFGCGDLPSMIMANKKNQSKVVPGPCLQVWNRERKRERETLIHSCPCRVVQWQMPRKSVLLLPISTRKRPWLMETAL